METQIKSLHDLEIVRACKRSVYGRSCEFLFGKKPLPASVVINFQGARILKIINHGLYIWDSDLHKQPSEPGRKDEQNGK
jgi:hypothetical protein